RLYATPGGTECLTACRYCPGSSGTLFQSSGFLARTDSIDRMPGKNRPVSRKTGTSHAGKRAAAKHSNVDAVMTCQPAASQIHRASASVYSLTCPLHGLGA